MRGDLNNLPWPGWIDLWYDLGDLTYAEWRGIILALNCSRAVAEIWPGYLPDRLLRLFQDLSFSFLDFRLRGV